MALFRSARRWVAAHPIITIVLLLLVAAVITLPIVLTRDGSRGLRSRAAVRAETAAPAPAAAAPGDTPFRAALRRLEAGEVVAVIVSKYGCPACENLKRLEKESKVPTNERNLIRLDVAQLIPDEHKEIQYVPALFVKGAPKSNGPFSQENVDTLHASTTADGSAPTVSTFKTARSAREAIDALGSMQVGVLAFCALDCGPSKFMIHLMEMAGQTLTGGDQASFAVLELATRSLDAEDPDSDELLELYKRTEGGSAGIQGFPSWIAKMPDGSVRAGAGYSRPSMILGLESAPAAPAQGPACDSH